MVAAPSQAMGPAKLLLLLLLLLVVMVGTMISVQLVRGEVDSLDCDADDDADGGAANATATACDAGDRRALLAFKAGIAGDPNCALASWARSSSNCCSWKGVTCDGGGRVIGLNLAQSGLSGRLPAALGSLSALLRLKLYENNFSGPLPGSLGNLSRLTKLCLDSATSSTGGFSGPIPESFSGLVSLQKLDISYNSLSGPLPSSIGKLSSLLELAAAHNKLAGPIPPSFANLSSLLSASLGSNELAGRIPSSFNAPGSRLANLAFLFLDDNRITGAPSSLARLANLQWVSLVGNPIGGLRGVAGLLTAPKLVRVELQRCGLSGPGLAEWLKNGFPRTNTEFVSEEVTPGLVLAANRLSGPIPSRIGSLLPDYFQALDLSGNRFSGRIPASIANLTSLGSLDLHSNELDGSIPPAFSALAASLALFNVSHNRLSGPIPQLPPFTELDPSAYAGNAGLCGTPLPPCRS